MMSLSIRKVFLFSFFICQFLKLSFGLPELFTFFDPVHQQILFQSLAPAAGDALNSIFNPVSDAFTKVIGTSPVLSSNDLLLVQEEVTRVLSNVQQSVLSGIKSNTVDIVDANKFKSVVDSASQFILTSYENFVKSDPRLKLATDQYASLVIKDDILPQINGASRNLIGSILDADPRLKLKTDEYVSLVVKDDLVPWLQSTQAKISAGPLVSGIRNTITGVSEQLASALSQGLDEGVLKPVGGALSVVGDAVGTQQRAFEVQIPSAAEFNQLVVQKAQANGQAIIDNIVPSLNRFSVNFGEALGKSGTKLSQNLQAFSDSSVVVFDRISSRMSQPRSIDLDAVQSSFKMPTAAVDLGDVQVRLQSRVSQLADKLSNPQFFVPPDNAKGENWIQQSAKFIDSLKDVKAEDVNKFTDNVVKSWDSIQSQTLSDPRVKTVGEFFTKFSSGELTESIKATLKATK